MAVKEVLLNKALSNPEVIGSFANGFYGGLFGAIVALSILAAIIIFAAVYAYLALAWQAIATKFKYKNSWLAWIPFANLAMILQLGGFHWAWIFLLLIPVLGWIAVFVLLVIATWHIFEARRYPGWYSLSMVIPKVGAILYLIAIGFVAWKDKKR